MRRLGRPHLVLLVVDTLRADRTSPYGAPPEVTPELDRWARRGIVFERAVAQSSWTKMSMATLFTSLWPRTHGIHRARDGLALDALTLAEALRSEGYRTSAVQTNGWLDQSFGFHQGFERYRFPSGAGAPGLGRPAVWPHADRVVAEAGRLIADHDPEQPLFLYLHFMDVHEYAAPPEFRRFGEDETGAYLAAVRWVDDALERLRRRLDEAGMLERSVLVLVSDHGEAFGEHGVHGHARDVRAPVLHVPWILRLPFPVEPVRISAQVRLVDLAPTLLDLAGIEVPDAFEGRSLLPALRAPRSVPDRTAFAALGEPLFADARTQQVVRHEGWTYARNLDGNREEQLFDRGVDPVEHVDLLPFEPERSERLRALLQSHRDGAPGPDVSERDVRIDPGIARRLQALGYLRSSTDLERSSTR